MTFTEQAEILARKIAEMTRCVVEVDLDTYDDSCFNLVITCGPFQTNVLEHRDFVSSLMKEENIDAIYRNVMMEAGVFFIEMFGGKNSHLTTDTDYRDVK